MQERIRLEWKERVFIPFVLKCMHLASDWFVACRNSNLIDFLLELHTSKSLPISLSMISSNPALTAAVLSKYVTMNWDYCLIREHSKISLQSMEPYRVLFRNGRPLPVYSVITIADVEKYTSAWSLGLTRVGLYALAPGQWDWKTISGSPGITMKDVLSRPLYPWDWRELSRNSGISMRDVLDHPHLPWDTFSVCNNPT